MSDQDTDGETQEAAVWHPDKSIYGGVVYLSVRTGDQVEPLQRLPEWMVDRIIADHRRAAKADAMLEFTPETIDYILEGFDGHEFDKAAAGRGMEMGCITCCQMQALYELRAALAEWAEIAAPEEAQG